MTEAEILDLHGQIRRDFERSYTERKQIQQGEIEQFSTVTEWSELKVPTGDIYDTSVPANKLKDLANKVFTLPGDFNAHPNVKKMYQARLDAVESGEGIDWGTAEALAWASLLDEGVNVRISGQDVERGTFSQRHAVLHDQQVDLKKYSPLTLAQSPSSTFQATNSHLAEYAVLGYEYGYALADPNALVMWEAQFGDFANGA
jgi:2-oxoglutarate dehydrogenase E1 component